MKKSVVGLTRQGAGLLPSNKGGNRPYFPEMQSSLTPDSTFPKRCSSLSGGVGIKRRGKNAVPPRASSMASTLKTSLSIMDDLARDMLEELAETQY